MIMVSRLFDLSKAINLNHLLLTKNQNCSKNSDYSLELVRPAHMQWPLVFSHQLVLMGTPNRS